MRRKVLIVGHADADGHLIAEQTRRNLELIANFDVKVVVDPQRTKDHRLWNSLPSLKEIEDADLVFFVDLMFSPKTFVSEATALVEFVNARPTKRFYLIDHHPLPARRLEEAKNLRFMYRPDVRELALGPRSGMMVVAAICERQADTVESIMSPAHQAISTGIRRAAALGGALSGSPLMALLKADCWRELAELGNDDNKLHYLPSGRRPMNFQASPALIKLEEIATSLLSKDVEKAYDSNDFEPGRGHMPYDIDIALERIEDGPQLRNSPPPAKDLEAIVTLLEVAALSLTTELGSTFSIGRLIREARDLAGDEIDLDERDAKTVLEKASFLEREGNDYRLR
jgi:hypothetical protein